MKRYTSIQNKTDIDLSKIHIENINDRYIDSQGNRYATRFNLRTRKIDIILLALGKDEVLEVKMRLRTQRREKNLAEGKTSNSNTNEALEVETPAEVEVKGMETPEVITKYQIKTPPVEEFNFDSYFISLEVELPKYLERLRGLMKVLQKFEIYNNTPELGEEFILTCENTFERSISELINDAQNLTVEMNKFPKPASAYMVHLSKEQRMIFDDLDTEEKKNHFLKATMVCNELFKAFEIALTMLDKIIINGYSFDEKDIPRELETQFNDFLMTAGFIKGNIVQELGKLHLMYKQAILE